MTNVQVQCLLRYLGFYSGSIDGQWGPLSAEAATRFQLAWGDLQADGIPGKQTCEALLQAVCGGMPETKPSGDDFWQSIQYFRPEEFMCKCRRGEGYCDGWPHPVQPLLVTIAERARVHFNVPILVISGLRCRRHNADVGGVANSQHMYGEAADIRAQGIPAETLLAWLRSQPDVRYAYRIPNSDNVHFDIANQRAAS